VKARDGGGGIWAFGRAIVDVIPTLLHSISFAAHKHRDQVRKGRGASPYINHPIEVAVVLADVGCVRDVEVLCAAILHDTIEDTETTAEELAENFGARVRLLVEEVTDDKSLEKHVRKRLAIEHAPHLSDDAKRIKLADKICNVRDVAHDPPAKWPHERRVAYLEWAAAVVAGLRGASAELEAEFDRVLAAGTTLLDQQGDAA
jgi:(p)ppGpp synthase/HD superfamily hydrolase